MTDRPTIPNNLRWQDVRMMSFDDNSRLSILMRGETEPRLFDFNSVEDRDAALKRWISGNDGQRE
jgi:hypothetical protein